MSDTQLLRQIAAQTAPSREHALVISKPNDSSSDRVSNFDVYFPTPIRPRPGRVLEMALTGVRTYHTWVNIDLKNNTLVYTPDGSNPARIAWKRVTVPDGTYEIETISGTIQKELKKFGDWDEENDEHYIHILPNEATQHAQIEITHPDYSVDIAVSKLRSVLGWPDNSAPLTAGLHEAPEIVQIQ